MDGRGSERSSRSRTGRALIATGSLLLPIRAGSARVHRRLECLSEEYHQSVSGKSEEDGRQRKMLLSRLAAVVHCDSDQTDQKETRGGNHTQDHTRIPGKSARAASDDGRMQGV